FRFATKLDVLLMVLGSLCAACHGVALPALMIIFGDMTDSFVMAGTTSLIPSNMTWNDTQDQIDDMMDQLMEDMALYAAYYAAVACGVLFAAYGQVTFWLLASNRQAQKLRCVLFSSVLKQDIGWFDTHEIGELNNRLSE
ncbi:hypothetical protein CAPTEDRAFT_48925, partial [Capitella teleta]